MKRKPSLKECLAKVDSLRAIIHAGHSLTEKEVQIIKAELEILLHDIDVQIKRLKHPA